MKKLSLLFPLMLFLIITCGEDDNPIGPSDEDEGEVVDIPTRFALTSPLGDTLNTIVPSFAWRSAVEPDMEDVEEYRLTVSTFESMESPTYTVRLANTSHTSFVLFTDDLKYYWTVSAYDNIIVDYQTQIQTLFATGCTASYCHGQGSGQGGLNLEAGASFNEITGSNTTSSAPLVIAGSPSLSPLIWRLEGKDNDGNSVTRMPPDWIMAQALIDRIRRWISQGAKFSVDDSVARFALSDTSFFLLDKQESPLDFSLIVPADSSEIDSPRPVFTWESSTDPDPRDEVKYTLIILNASDPSSVVYMSTGIEGTTHQVGEDIGTGSYNWHVIAEDSDNESLDTQSNEVFNFSII